MRALVFLCLMTITMPALAAKTYCCLDAGGRQICGDLLPQECYGRAYREINERGVTLHQIEAPLTAEQKAKREAEIKRQKEEERIALEEKRQAQMLVSTYASEQDIDFVRDRILADLDNFRKQALERHQEALKRKQQLDNEAEFYKKKPLPHELKTQIQANQAEIQAQLAVVESKQKEMEAVRAKFDQDKKRYLELVRGKGMAPAANTTDARPR